ncbi:VC0807 family protein [Actinokineospora enzanensis]|uniref:VC0807 family protein n=1 Tax=Actinokineospora enzanensis TaxID=155975 RepID=UPI00035E0343|nr:VC0807 family protein [Actinokineospora enzanensis]
MSGPINQTGNAQRGRGVLRQVLPLLLADVVLPVVVYFALHLQGASDTVALSAAGAASLIRLVFSAVRTKRVDGLAAFVFLLFAAGLVASLLVGDPRLVIAKDSAFSAAIGLGFLGSLLIGRPVMYFVSRWFLSGGDPAAWDELWQRNAGLRRKVRTMTVLCAVLFFAEAVVRIPVVYSMDLSVSEAEGASKFITLGMVVALGVVGRTLGRGIRRDVKELGQRSHG